MSDYIVSARKYRPADFESLIGQDNIVQTLKNSIKRGQLAHAYLFCGPRGVGKTSAARIFARTINCSNPGPDMEPCGECESCRSFAEGRSYCIHELDAASNNGVEDIKALMDVVQIPPQVGKYSVYIVDEVHMLSPAAFNAFLKTLEEPPSYAIFILATTEKHKILPTILSRCQTYDFNRISIPDIVRNLKGIASKEGITIDEESLHVIAHKADGAMRDALTIFDQTVAFCGNVVHCEDVMRNLNVLDYEYGFRVVDYSLKGDYASSLLLFDEVLSKGFNALYFVSALSSHLRDLLVSKTGGLSSLVDMPESLSVRYVEQASRCSVKFIFDALDICSQCEAGYRTSANQRLHIEFALMKLAFLCGGVQGGQVAVSAKPATAAPSAPAASASVAAKPKAAAEKTVETAKPTRTAPAVENAPAGEVAKPTAEPAPVSSAQQPPTPEAPKEAKRPSRAASSLSLSSLMKDDIAPSKQEDSPKEAALRALHEGRKPLDIESVKAAWGTLAADYSSQPRLSSLLSRTELKISDSGEEEGVNIVEFSVSNDAQKRWIEEKVLRGIETRIRALLKDPALRLMPVVSAEEEKAEVKYMPSEKAEDLMSRNENVKNLVKDLALDVK